MQDYAQARTNMVDCQIHTNGVIDPRILDAFETVPRERYVPATLKNVAYLDEDIVLPNGRILLEPQIHARMLQAVKPHNDDVALIIGDGCGYASAILAKLVTTVLSLSDHPEELDQSSIVSTEQGLCNIVTLNGALKDGAAQHAPYTLIFINGAVSEIPENLKSQLDVGGRLVCVLKQSARMTGKVVVMECLGDGKFSSYTHFDAGTPFIPEFMPKTVFEF